MSASSSWGWTAASVRKVMLEVEPSAGVTLRGSIDAVFDDGEAGTRLVDWKTAGLGDPGPQLSFYSLLWAMQRRDPGESGGGVRGFGERTDEVPCGGRAGNRAAGGTSRHRTPHELERGGSFERVAGPWCRWCPLLDECSEGQAAKRAIFERR